jgi:hypothetical protein
MPATSAGVISCPAQAVGVLSVEFVPVVVAVAALTVPTTIVRLAVTTAGIDVEQ